MWLSTAVVSLVVGSVLAIEAQQESSLKILVLAGEGAVNIIQQKTAVRPLVEVRDRNNLPVAGATVTFSIGGGGSGAAFAGGVQTLTVTTNAAGQAAASGLNALSSGAFQIQVQAAYQGQIATAAISQTNFATAAAATQAGASAGGGGTATGATGGAAGGGGGLSATTIAIVGAAVGGGALAATQALDKLGTDVYNGSLSGQLLNISIGPSSQSQQNTCTRTEAITGSIKIALKDGGATGNATVELKRTEVSVTAPCVSNPPWDPVPFEDIAVSGGPSALTFTGSTTRQDATYTFAFKGSLSDTTISGTLGIDVAFRSSAPPFNTSSGSTTLQVTLQK